jgi:hypothetical protein
MASQSHRMCVPDSSFSRHLPQVRLSVNPTLKRCPFMWQSLVSSSVTHCNWFLFKFKSSLVLLAEGPCMSFFACSSPVQISQCAFMISGCPLPDSFLGNSYWDVQVSQLTVTIKHTNVMFPFSPLFQCFSYRTLNNKRTGLELESMNVTTKLAISQRLSVREENLLATLFFLWRVVWEDQGQTDRPARIIFFPASRCVTCIKGKLRGRQHNLL